MTAREQSPRFVWSDAWILLALLYSGGKEGTDLRATIAAADFINHAIPTYDELNGALARLQAARYLERRGRTYRVTPRVLSAYAEIGARRRLVQKELDDLQSFLGVEHSIDSPSSPPNEDQLRAFSRRAYERAVKAYRQAGGSTAGKSG